MPDRGLRHVICGTGGNPSGQPQNAVTSPNLHNAFLSFIMPARRPVGIADYEFNIAAPVQKLRRGITGSPAVSFCKEIAIWAV
jgi:hypothetical protein